jgi:hypothetical protein
MFREVVEGIVEEIHYSSSSSSYYYLGHAF